MNEVSHREPGYTFNRLGMSAMTTEKYDVVVLSNGTERYECNRCKKQFPNAHSAWGHAISCGTHRPRGPRQSKAASQEFKPIPVADEAMTMLAGLEAIVKMARAYADTSSRIAAAEQRALFAEKRLANIQRQFKE